MEYQSNQRCRVRDSEADTMDEKQDVIKHAANELRLALETAPMEADIADLGVEYSQLEEEYLHPSVLAKRRELCCRSRDASSDQERKSISAEIDALDAKHLPVEIKEKLHDYERQKTDLLCRIEKTEKRFWIDVSRNDWFDAETKWIREYEASKPGMKASELALQVGVVVAAIIIFIATLVIFG